MKRSRTLLAIALAIVLCSAVFAVMVTFAPIAHAQGSPPPPRAGCGWVNIAFNENDFSYGGISGYELRAYLWADYNNTSHLACHHMFTQVAVWTPSFGYGTTLWAYLDNCSGDAVRTASAPVLHGLHGVFTLVYTSSYTEDCGQAGAAEYSNGNFMAIVWTVTSHD